MFSRHFRIAAVLAPGGAAETIVTGAGPKWGLIGGCKHRSIKDLAFWRVVSPAVKMGGRRDKSRAPAARRPSARTAGRWAVRPEGAT